MSSCHPCSIILSSSSCHLFIYILVLRKKVGGKTSTKAKPKFKSYAEARKDREKFRKKLVGTAAGTVLHCTVLMLVVVANRGHILE